MRIASGEILGDSWGRFSAGQNSYAGRQQYLIPHFPLPADHTTNQRTAISYIQQTLKDQKRHFSKGDFYSLINSNYIPASRLVFHCDLYPYRHFLHIPSLSAKILHYG